MKMLNHPLCESDSKAMCPIFLGQIRMTKMARLAYFIFEEKKKKTLGSNGELI